MNPFTRADPEHHRWATTCPYVAEQERALVRAAFLPLGERVIDLGCGEGGTLYHLDAPPSVGVDLFEAKTAFAREQQPEHEWVTASALDLPFEDARFDHVIVRDLLHHLDEPAALIDEAHRVLSPGGRIDILEPCRNNPLVAAHALLLPHERGELRSTAHFLARHLERRFSLERVSRHQPMPLHRVIFHPTFGMPALAAKLGTLIGVIESAAELLPQAMWSYIHLRGHK